MMEKTKLDTLVEILREAPDEVFVQPHNVPDPDAIAASLGVYGLLKARGLEKTKIVYDLEIEKANSLKMLELFDVPMIRAADAHTLGTEDWAVLVDVQKGGSNITDLPTDEVAVIDHHEYMGNQGYRFEDVRPDVGSCSAIVAEYYFENNETLSRDTATALLYGIFMDTDKLTRGANSLDIDMFYKLYNLADIAKIAELQGNEITKQDLGLYAEAFRTVETYDDLGFLRLNSSNDSLLGTAGDIVVSVSGVNIVVAYAIRDTGIKLSVRSTRPGIKANDLVRHLVAGCGKAGGHDHMAGGFIPLENLLEGRSIDTFLRHRALAFYEAH